MPKLPNARNMTIKHNLPATDVVVKVDVQPALDALGTLKHAPSFLDVCEHGDARPEGRECLCMCRACYTPKKCICATCQCADHL